MKANEQSTELAPHYKKRETKEGKQHWDRMWEKYREAWFVGNITKYVERYRDKNGMADLIKARHYLDKLIELEEAEAGQDKEPEQDIGGGGGTGDAKPVCINCGKSYERDRLLEGKNSCEECESKFKLEVKKLEKDVRGSISHPPSYPGNARKSNGQLMCGCWGVECEGHEETPIGESS